MEQATIKLTKNNSKATVKANQTPEEAAARAERNRSAQRAFRQRREQYVKELEWRSAQLENLLQEYHIILEENQGLRMRVEAMIQHLTQLGGTVPQLPPLPTAGAATMLTSSSTMASRMVDGNQIPYYNNGYQYYNHQAQQMQQRNNSTGEFQHTLSYSDFLYENDLRRTEYNSSGANSYEPLLVNRGGSYPGGIILKNNGASPSVLSPMGGGVGPGPMAEPNHSNGGATANGNGNPYSIVEGSGAVAVMNSGGGVFSGDQLALVEMNQNYNSKGLLVDGNSGNGNGNGNGNAGENEGDDDVRGNTRKKAAAGEKSRRRKKK